MRPRSPLPSEVLASPSPGRTTAGSGPGHLLPLSRPCLARSPSADGRRRGHPPPSHSTSRGGGPREYLADRRTKTRTTNRGRTGRAPASPGSCWRTLRSPATPRPAAPRHCTAGCAFRAAAPTHSSVPASLDAETTALRGRRSHAPAHRWRTRHCQSSIRPPHPCRLQTPWLADTQKFERSSLANRINKKAVGYFIPHSSRGSSRILQTDSAKNTAGRQRAEAFN
mmetsp:Transcript_28976/g.73247  ORF Transcript_28976/g.73247 Transcript_28976/m.73247 type:complete len:225 (-) Transcript_28976:49-723(-)